MSKSTIFLLIILLLTVSVFYVFKKSYIKNSALQNIPEVQATPTPDSESTLTLTPGNLTVNNGIKSSIDVVLDQNGYPPTIIQLEMVYDPNELTNIQLVQGNYFTNPTVLLNTIDEKTGRISYALAASDQDPVNKNKGVVATIYFTPRINALQPATSLYFLPKSAVKIQGEVNTLKAMYGTKILIGQGIVPPPTPSGQIKR